MPLREQVADLVAQARAAGGNPARVVAHPLTLGALVGQTVAGLPVEGDQRVEPGVVYALPRPALPWLLFVSEEEGDGAG